MIKKQLMGLSPLEEISDVLMEGAVIPDNDAYTMIGWKRLCNIELLIKNIIENNIPGDLIETGVWRGGACIYMKYILNQLNSNKKIYVADSFCGLPAPNEKNYPVDKGDSHHMVSELSCSREAVENNFKKFNLLDDGIIFIEGWFRDTLPKIKANFSIIRLDGDMYESTWNALENLYPKLNMGGFCIIDDWNTVIGANYAVKDYRKKNNIQNELIYIGISSVYWKK